MRTLTLTETRRLAIVAQRLAGERPPSGARAILDTVRALGHLQLDPTNAVARSHLLVLWSRLGPYNAAHLETLLWQHRRLFEYRAFIYPIEDYPLHAWRMRRFGRGDGTWPRRIRAFMEQNRALRQYVLTRLRREGPLPSRAFEDRSVLPWAYTGGWNTGRNVGMMLELLSAQGRIMVAGRDGGQRLWDLTERVLPARTPQERLNEREFSRRVAEQRLLTKGVDRIAAPTWWVTAPTRGLRTGPAAALADLERKGRVEQVRIQAEGGALPGRWYMSSGVLPLLERLRRGEWQPRATLLSPFDTLINDRARTEQLFDFHYRVEIYVPKEKRQYGYFVMPILQGEQLIGRIDPLLDRDSGTLRVNAVYAEPTAPTGLGAGRAVARAVEDLAAFLGAREIIYGRKVPTAWRKAFHS